MLNARNPIAQFSAAAMTLGVSLQKEANVSFIRREFSSFSRRKGCESHLDASICPLTFFSSSGGALDALVFCYAYNGTKEKNNDRWLFPRSVFAIACTPCPETFYCTWQRVGTVKLMEITSASLQRRGGFNWVFATVCTVKLQTPDSVFAVYRIFLVLRTVPAGGVHSHFRRSTTWAELLHPITALSLVCHSVNTLAAVRTHSISLFVDANLHPPVLHHALYSRHWCLSVSLVHLSSTALTTHLPSTHPVLAVYRTHSFFSLPLRSPSVYRDLCSVHSTVMYGVSWYAMGRMCAVSWPRSPSLLRIPFSHSLSSLKIRRDGRVPIAATGGRGRATSKPARCHAGGGVEGGSGYS